MKHLSSAIFIALVLVIGLAGSASAHTATPSCESITLARAPQNSTADVKSGSTVILNDVPGNGTYAIAVGVYTVVWSDGYKVQYLEVSACPIPSATPSPTPDPSSSPIPSPSPSASSSTPPSPSPTSSPICEGTCSRPTAPPTDTETPPQEQAPTPVTLIIFGLIALALAAYSASPRSRRPR